MSDSAEFTSDDKHELGGDVGDVDDEDDPDRFGNSILVRLARGGDRFSFNSSLGPFPFRFIATWTTNVNTLIVSQENKILIHIE